MAPVIVLLVVGVVLWVGALVIVLGWTAELIRAIDRAGDSWL